MSEQQQVKSSTDMNEDLLPFVVELWTEDRSEVQSVLARVQSASLGHAVFAASRADFPGRHLTLRHGPRILVDTSAATPSAQHS